MQTIYRTLSSSFLPNRAEGGGGDGGGGGLMHPYKISEYPKNSCG